MSRWLRVRPSLRMAKASSGVSANWKRSRSLTRDGALFGEHLEVDHFLPVLRSVDDDGDLLGELVGLGEGEKLEHFVEGAEAAGENDQRLGQVGEPVLAHEEVVELEVERGRDEGVGQLLEGQRMLRPMVLPPPPRRRDWRLP